MSSRDNINALLKKTEHYDKDERYMATSDLCEVLKRTSESSSSAGGSHRSSSMDATTERRICTAVLRLLHDKSNDVQAIAVKTLGVLLTTVQEEQILEIADSLADQVLDTNKSELRDVYAIGLRTLIKTIPAASGEKTSQRLVGRLLEGIRSNSNGGTEAIDDEIVLACLDILTDLLGRFGATAISVTRQHEPILQMCLSQINHPSPVVRKRAGTTMGCLSIVLSDALLVSMVERLLGQLEEDGHDTRALIRTMCTVSGAVGHRLQQPQIDRMVPIFLKYTKPEEALTGDDEFDDEDEDGNGDTNGDLDMRDDAAVALANELKESCFMGFESFVLRCPTQVRPHLEKIIQASLAYMSYDPNYSYGDDDDENEGGDDEYDDEYDDDGDYEDDDDEDDDDDDESWKVRRSAIRALKAVVECQKDDPSMLWTKSFPTRKKKSTIVAMGLVGRFKEREENCRVGVLDCFTRLLAVTIEASQSGVLSIVGGAGDAMDTSNSPSIDLQSKYAPALVKACEKLLSIKKGGERSKSNALALLSTLCQAPGGVGSLTEILSVFQHIQTFLAAGTDTSMHREASSKTLRLDALSLVHAMLTCNKHDPVHIRKGLQQSLLPQLCQAVQEQWYKVIAEALRTLAAVPRFFVAGYEGSDESVDTQESQKKEVSDQLYGAIEPLLGAHDVDQEIKECALKACAALLGNLHSNLNSDQTNRLLSLLLERLKNETTRIVAIKTLSTIASSSIALRDDMDTDGSLKLDLSPILSESIETMAGFLKLQSRSLKQSSLEALDIVVSTTATANESLYSNVLPELAPLVGDADLHIAHLALRAAISEIKAAPACGAAAREYVLPKALGLSVSPLLQDLALDSLLAFLEQMIVSGSVDFADLLKMLRGNLEKAGGNKHAIESLAKSIATITAATTTENRDGVINETLASLTGSPTPDNAAALKTIQLGILLSGDLGRMLDYSSMGDVAEKFLTIYMGYFESSSEDLKNAAAYALGRATVGAQAAFLPAIVDSLEKTNQKKQYLLLSALRQFIQCSYQKSGGEGIASSLPVILPHLERHSADSEEGVRTMVAECMGSLACMQPAMILEKLSQLVATHSKIEAPNGTIDPADEESKKNAMVGWTAATSIKLAVAGKADQAQLALHMPSLLKLLEQKELGVRNAALLMVYSAVHHMPQLVAGLMKEHIMPSLYEVASFKLERKVDLGPFTHTVDDALPLRKASLSIFATCLENLPASLDIAAFMPVLAKALGDVEDVQLQAHQIVISMCIRQPTYIVAAVESFVEPLEKTYNKKQGQKTGTELERLIDWKKSALRTMIALSKLEGAMNNRKFAEFCERTNANSKFRPLLDAIADER